MKRILTVVIIAFILTGCNAVDDFNLWGIGCPGFPTATEAEKTLGDHEELFEGFLRNNLSNGIRVRECPHGAYILISHGSIKQKPLMLKAMDKINAREKGHRMFFDIPFSFHNN